MQDYEDVQQHVERHMKRSAEKYVDGLQKAGLQPNARLTKAVAERALAETRENYIQNATALRDRNIKMILKKIRRRSARRRIRQRLLLCVPLVLVFGAMAWYSFRYTHNVALGAGYISGALILVILSVLGAVFDQW